MNKKIKTGDTVIVLATGSKHKVIDIQYEHNRYQLKYVSNWQHGIESIRKA